jgi:hypothetical protein
MFRLALRRYAVAASLSVVCFGFGSTRGEDARQGAPRVQTPAEAKIRHALNEPAVMEFIETPLQDVVDYLKDFHKIEIQINKKALDEYGISSDTPITRNLRGISLRSALDLVFRDLDLDYVIANEVLLITTQADARTRTVLRTYDVSDLVDSMHYAEHLADVLRTAVIKPAATRAQGGDPTGDPLPRVDDRRAVVAYKNLLIVRETERVHAEIDALFSEMRARLKADQAQLPAAPEDEADPFR